MIYVYDTVLAPYETSLKRYGANYKLEKVSRMGEQRFYNFACAGREKILVVPHFAIQYREVEKIYQGFKDSKKYETYLSHIKKKINRYPVIETMPDEDSVTGERIVITVDYKDIQVQFFFMGDALLYSNEFEIIDNNLFGNGGVVSMNINMEET